MADVLFCTHCESWLSQQEYDEHEKWRLRDQRREFHEAVMRDRALAERDRLCGVIEAALDEFDCTGGKPWDEVARIAVDALVADGVVFASISPNSDIAGSEAQS